jgi:hypothetical protein
MKNSVLDATLIVVAHFQTHVFAVESEDILNRLYDFAINEANLADESREKIPIHLTHQVRFEERERAVRAILREIGAIVGIKISEVDSIYDRIRGN